MVNRLGYLSSRHIRNGSLRPNSHLLAIDEMLFKCPQYLDLNVFFQCCVKTKRDVCVCIQPWTIFCYHLVNYFITEIFWSHNLINSQNRSPGWSPGRNHLWLDRPRPKWPLIRDYRALASPCTFEVCSEVFNAQTIVLSKVTPDQTNVCLIPPFIGLKSARNRIRSDSNAFKIA